jgi:hypothetical protein
MDTVEVGYERINADPRRALKQGSDQAGQLELALGVDLERAGGVHLGDSDAAEEAVAGLQKAGRAHNVERPRLLELGIPVLATLPHRRVVIDTHRTIRQLAPEEGVCLARREHDILGPGRDPVDGGIQVDWIDKRRGGLNKDDNLRPRGDRAEGVQNGCLRA